MLLELGVLLLLTSLSLSLSVCEATCRVYNRQQSKICCLPTVFQSLLVGVKVASVNEAQVDDPSSCNAWTRVISHMIENFYIANFANHKFPSKSASCSRWTSWHRSGSPSGQHDHILATRCYKYSMSRSQWVNGACHCLPKSKDAFHTLGTYFFTVSDLFHFRLLSGLGPASGHLVQQSKSDLAVNHSLSSFIVVQSWELTSQVHANARI